MHIFYNNTLTQDVVLSHSDSFAQVTNHHKHSLDLGHVMHEQQVYGTITTRIRDTSTVSEIR